MISPQTFSLFLLVVCILACVLSVLSLTRSVILLNTSNRWVRGFLALAFFVLAITSGVAASLLVLLK